MSCFTHHFLILLLSFSFTVVVSLKTKTKTKKGLVFPKYYTGQEPFTHCSAAQVSSAMNCLIIHFTHFSIGPFVFFLFFFVS